MKTRQRGYFTLPGGLGVHRPADAGGINPDFANVDLLLHADSESSGPDALFADVRSLLAFNAANGSTTTSVYDQAGGSPVTPSASAAISTAQSKHGGASLLQTANGQYVVRTITAPGTGDFCVEAWVYLTTTGKLNYIFGQTTEGIHFRVNDSNKLELLRANVVSICTGATSLSANTWYHCAASRSGTTARVFLDGVEDGSGTSSHNFTLTDSRVGGWDTAADSLRGYIDDFRFTGAARYTASFTPPGVIARANTNYPDSSTAARLCTPYGNAALSSAQSKFGSYSLAFDGNEDAVIVNGLCPGAGTSDFTVEAWVRLDSNARINQIVAQAKGGYNLSTSSLGKLKFAQAYVGDVLTGSITIPSATWVHVAASRNSGTLRLFVDGVLDASVSDSTNYTTGEIGIGGYIDLGTTCMLGYIDEIRICREGTYTASFTPPTTPFPNS